MVNLLRGKGELYRVRLITQPSFHEDVELRRFAMRNVLGDIQAICRRQIDDNVLHTSRPATVNIREPRGESVSIAR